MVEVLNKNFPYQTSILNIQLHISISSSKGKWIIKIGGNILVGNKLYNVHFSYEFYLSSRCVSVSSLSTGISNKGYLNVCLLYYSSAHMILFFIMYIENSLWFTWSFSEDLLAICRTIPISGFCEGIVIQSLQDLGLQCSIGPTMRHDGISPKKGCELILNMFSLHKGLCKI